MFTRTKILASGAAVVGAGLLVAGPLSAAAFQEDTDPTSTTTPDTATPKTAGGGWVQTALDELVADATITQAQADAIVTKLAQSRPEHDGHGRGGRGHHHGGVRAGLDDVATVLGIEDEALRAALREGQTLAEIAVANGSTAQAVIDVLVANADTRIDAAVTAGRIDETEAEERRAEAVERITELVNEGAPAGHGDDTATTSPTSTTEG